jgi:ArsR family transcriptional regulator
MATTELIPMADRERGVCCVPTRRLREGKVHQMSEVLKALADPTRLEMVTILKDATEPVCVCDFVATFGLSQPTVSHHMARLREAGLVESEKRGIWAFYRLRRDLPAVTRRLVEALG